MAEERRLFRRSKKKDPKKKKEKKKRFKGLKVAYRSIEEPKKYVNTILAPLIILGALFLVLPFILPLFSIELLITPLAFLIVGIIVIILGILYPYITWKNKEVEINENMHFFITHLRVLSISDMGFKDIIKLLGGKKVYKTLGEEVRKIGVLSINWKSSVENALRFVAERTPSKILKDFLDRFSQSVASGVAHKDFVEHEQEGVMEEYKTMYESSNEVISILNELYVALLTSIVFLTVFGIIAPSLVGGGVNTYVYGACFIFVASEVLLLYFTYSFIPKDDIWHITGKKSDTEKKINFVFKISIVVATIITTLLIITKYIFPISLIQELPYEIAVAICITPLIASGIMVYIEEGKIQRREKSFIGFLPSLGNISTMRGGKISDAVAYLGKKERDFGILSDNIISLSKRLRTRIDDALSWEWFGVETHSNLIQRFSEIYREATYAAANPRIAGNVITENFRKIKNLRFKKLTILKTTTGLFYGVTFGVTLTLYVALVISRHMDTLTASMGGNPFETMGIQLSILEPVGESVIAETFLLIFIVLVIHCTIIAITIKVLGGSHKYIVLLHVVPLVWIVSLSAVFTDWGLQQLLQTTP
jgi:flagellar protein FlaJ